MAGQRRDPRALVEMARPVFEAANQAWNEGNFERVYGALPEEFEYALGVTWPNHRPLRGPNEVIAFFEDFRETFPDTHAGPLEFLEVGDRTMIVSFPVTGTGRSSGAGTEMEIWQLWDFDEQLRPLRVREFPDREATLEAASVRQGRPEDTR